MRGGTYCVVPGCFNSSGKKTVSMFKFPKHPERARLWLSECQREDLFSKIGGSLYRCYKICAVHFEDIMFSNVEKNRLLPVAVPTIFPSLGGTSKNRKLLMQQVGEKENKAHGYRKPSDSQIPKVPFICEQSILESYYCGRCHFETKIRFLFYIHLKQEHGTDPKPHISSSFRKYSCESCPFESHSLLFYLKHFIGGCTKEQPVKTVQWFKCDQCPHKTKWFRWVNAHEPARRSCRKEIQMYQVSICDYTEITCKKPH